MTSREFKDLEEAFEKAVSLEGEERSAYLTALDLEQPDLAKRVRQLLKADAAGETVPSAIAASVKALGNDAVDTWVGRTIGDWRLTERLGLGGMGAVFLVARVDKQYEQTAALKIMGAQLLDANAAARFRAERQILANLNHPNIATLIDGGSTEDGTPFLVMEYVDGVRIDEYCDSKNLTIDERLSLFQELCTAVDYAHRNLVVHRDLKPSNMLVTGDGTPKLLDFGIAKLLETDDNQLVTARTVDGARMMTPEYASPEQIRGEPVSVATDVYALGVLLFRLLTGHSPYGRTANTPREIESAILDETPKKPSASITEYFNSGDELRSAGNMQNKSSVALKRLRRTLSGDLDTIILKCLQKEPERRYAACRELAIDIGRYLDKRPILARKDSWIYKAKKFVTRNARPVAAAAISLITIISLVFFYTLRLASERDKAQMAAAEAEQVASFLGDMFSSASPTVTQGEAVTVLDVIDSAISNIDALEGQEELQGKLLFIMGESYYWLGKDAEAVALYERSLTHFERVTPKPVLGIIESLIGLGETQARLGRSDEAFETLESGRILALKQLGPYSSKTLWFETLIASNLIRQRRREEALPLLEAVLEKLSLSPDHSDELELYLLTDLAIALDSVGRIDESVAYKHRVIEKSEAVEGVYHPGTIVRIYNFGLGMRRQWRLEEALEQMKIANERGATTWGREDPTRRAHLRGYAINLEILGRFDEAMLLREEERDLALEIDGEESRNYVIGLLGVAVWNKDRGYLKTAAAKFEDTLTRSISINGESSFFTTLCRLFLAQTYNEMAEYEDALIISSAAMENIDVLSESLSVSLRMQHAFALLANGQKDMALTLVEELVSLRDADGTQSGAHTVSIFTDFAKFYRRAELLEKATSYAARAHFSGSEKLPTGNWHTALATAEYAYALAASDESAEAKKLAAQAYADLSAIFGPDDYRARSLKMLIDETPSDDQK